MKMYDVAIIGAGPSGSWLASRLAERGHQVVVLEQKKGWGEPICCTGIVSQECVEHYAIEDSVIFRRANSARVFSPSGKLLRLWRPEPQACILDRPALNLSLARRAQEKGAEYRLNTPVRGIEVEDNAVSIKTGDGEGQVEAVKARAAVIATGFGSKLVEGLGLGKFGDAVAGAQAEVATNGVDEVEVYLGQQIAPAFFAWLVPTLPQRAIVGLLSRRRPGFYLKNLISSLKAQGKITSVETGLSYGGIPLRPPARSYSDRVVVVGTAAGQVKPTTGGGVYYGLLCADIAADNLGQALKNDALSARNLANYEKEWRERLGWELRIGYWARKFYERLSDGQVDRIFDIIKNNGIDEALLKSDDLTFDSHGKAVLKLIGYKALSRIVEIVKLPFPGRSDTSRKFDSFEEAAEKNERRKQESGPG
ncbi:MAG: NAD(P)/FAD-dependent oxidoreductase [Dehalococcoidales bacterium]|nr:NAD(P)/FAD-dependent oxidoreductase [Dehalococcoidales bacterium]